MSDVTYESELHLQGKRKDVSDCDLPGSLERRTKNVNLFPSADPIPLPAPVWLFKVLHNLTLTLHLAAVELLLGGLMLGILLAALGRLRKSQYMVQAGGMIAHRLPTVMAMLINLGVPPLLFAQVLYGRALYTSSVLIGAYWISVIFLLMGSYYGLYYSAKRADARRPWSATGLAALVLALTIAFIYTNNMTLMLRPQVWAEMYRHSPSGVQWNTSDSTVWPRWFFFVFGSFSAAGAGLMLLAQRAHFEERLRRFLFRFGAGALAAGVVFQVVFARMAIAAQPSGIVTAVMGESIYSLSAYAWMAAATAAALIAVWALLSRTPRPIAAMSAALAVFLNLAATVMVRDGIRDVTLRAAGFEVWDRHVVTNWSVVGVFLILFVAALGMLGYLIRVVAKARRIEERYA